MGEVAQFWRIALTANTGPATTIWAKKISGVTGRTQAVLDGTWMPPDVEKVK